jgi:hypothetical protein
MHEAQKLKEAWYFLVEMHAKVPDPHAFVHCLSAFLSASRPPVQYLVPVKEWRFESSLRQLLPSSCLAHRRCLHFCPRSSAS